MSYFPGFSTDSTPFSTIRSSGLALVCSCHHDFDRGPTLLRRAAVFRPTLDPGEELLHLSDGEVRVLALELLPCRLLAVEQTHFVVLHVQEAVSAIEVSVLGLVAPGHVALDDKPRAALEARLQYAQVLGSLAALVPVGSPLDLGNDPLRCRVAEVVAHGVDVVGVGVEQSAAAVAPDERGLANGALGDQLFRPEPRPHEPALMADDELDVVLAGGGDHRVGFAQARGHGLLTEDALHPRTLRRRDGNRPVRALPGADEHQVRLFLVQQFAEVRVRPLDSILRGIPLDPVRSRVAGGDDLDLVEGGVRLRVVVGDPSAADGGEGVRVAHGWCPLVGSVCSDLRVGPRRAAEVPEVRRLWLHGQREFLDAGEGDLHLV